MPPQFESPELSLQVKQHRLLRDMGLGDLRRESLFPVFKLGRNFVAVDCDSGSGSGAPWYVSVDSISLELLCDSLAGFLQVVIGGFRDGAFVHNSGYPDVLPESDPVAWTRERCNPCGQS